MRKPGLCTQNTPTHITACISFTVHNFRNLQAAYKIHHKWWTTIITYKVVKV